MERYIKVNNRWIDTLMDQKENGNYYYEMDGIIWCLPKETMIDYVIGKLQDQSATPVQDPLEEFFKLYPKGGYKRYKEWCKTKPVSKKVFRSYKK